MCHNFAIFYCLFSPHLSLRCTAALPLSSQVQVLLRAAPSTHGSRRVRVYQAHFSIGIENSLSKTPPAWLRSPTFCPAGNSRSSHCVRLTVELHDSAWVRLITAHAMCGWWPFHFSPSLSPFISSQLFSRKRRWRGIRLKFWLGSLAGISYFSPCHCPVCQPVSCVFSFNLKETLP